MHNTACSRFFFFYAKNHPFFNYSPQIPIGKNFSLLTIKKYFVNL